MRIFANRDDGRRGRPGSEVVQVVRLKPLITPGRLAFQLDAVFLTGSFPLCIRFFVYPFKAKLSMLHLCRGFTTAHCRKANLRSGFSLKAMRSGRPLRVFLQFNKLLPFKKKSASRGRNRIWLPRVVKPTSIRLHHSDKASTAGFDFGCFAF